MGDWAFVGDALAEGFVAVGMRRWACWGVLVAHSCWRDACATTVDTVADSEPPAAGGFAFGRDSVAQATFENLASCSAFGHAAVAVGELDDCERIFGPVSVVLRPDAAARAKSVVVDRSNVHGCYGST